MRKIWIGIDPGKSGALVAIHSDGTVEKHVVPIVSEEVDLNSLSQLFFFWKPSENVQVMCVLEDVHSIFNTSAKSNFQFGRVLGMLEMALASYSIPFVKVSPKKWQKVCFEGVPTKTKVGKAQVGHGTLDAKAMALVAVARLYPTVSCIPTAKSKKPHDGIVDALLMAHYCKITFN